jgi:hypothetical protein
MSKWHAQHAEGGGEGRKQQHQAMHYSTKLFTTFRHGCMHGRSSSYQQVLDSEHVLLVRRPPRRYQARRSVSPSVRILVPNPCDLHRVGMLRTQLMLQSECCLVHVFVCIDKEVAGLAEGTQSRVSMLLLALLYMLLKGGSRSVMYHSPSAIASR